MPELLDAPRQYPELLQFIWKDLGYPDVRKPLLIGIDGRDGAGKSALALWLGYISISIILICNKIDIAALNVFVSNERTRYEINHMDT